MTWNEMSEEQKIEVATKQSDLTVSLRLAVIHRKEDLKKSMIGPYADKEFWQGRLDELEKAEKFLEWLTSWRQMDLMARYLDGEVK